MNHCFKSHCFKSIPLPRHDVVAAFRDV